MNELVVTKNASFEDRKNIYNILTNANIKVSDMVKETIVIDKIYFTTGTYTDGNTGETIENAERVILVDKDGESYHSMSVGIISSAKNLLNCFGDFNDIEDAQISVKVVPKKTKKGTTYLFEIVD